MRLLADVVVVVDIGGNLAQVIKGGTDVNQINSKGVSALHIAVQNGLRQ